MKTDQNKRKIIFYGSNWCADCRRSKELLDSLGVDYEYINLEKDPTAVERVLEINKGYQSINPDYCVFGQPCSA